MTRNSTVGRTATDGLRWGFMCAAIGIFLTPPPALPAEPQLAAPIPIAEFARRFEAGLEPSGPVRIRGRITGIQPGHTVVFTIEDDTGGATVYVGEYSPIHPRWPAIQGSLGHGKEVVVEGVERTTSDCPMLSASDIVVVGQGDLPPAPPADLPRLFSGADMVRRLSIEGVVQARIDEANQTGPLNRDIWQLRVLCDSRTIPVFLSKRVFPHDPVHLLDAVVRFTGVSGMFRNPRGEFLGPWIEIHRPEDVSVIVPPAADPFAGPFHPLDRIATYRSAPSTGHRVRTAGTVSLVSEARGFFVIQEGLHGVLVGITGGPPPAEGERVEVAGFLDMRRNVSALSGAVFRSFGGAAVPPAVEVSPDEIIRVVTAARLAGKPASPTSYEGCRVRFRGRVVEAVSPDAGGVAMLASGRSLVEARFVGRRGPGSDTLPVGGEVEIAGVVQLPFASDEGPTPPDLPPRFELLVAGPDDVVVLRRPSWWSAPRLLAALAAVTAVALASAGWSLALRRQVARQMAVITRSLRSEAATEERHRIAREFHDSLEQDLAGIALRIDAAAHRADDAQTRGFLEEQHGLLDRLRADTHDFLWDLRDPARNDGSLLESAAAQIAHLRSITDVPLVLDAPPDMPRVSPAVQFHLLRMIREAVANALKHGVPNRIDVRLRPAGDAVVLEVADDGCGFEVADAVARQGHFGIRGIRERVRQLGGSCDIQSVPGAGTRVMVTVPTRAADGGGGDGASDNGHVAVGSRH